MALSYNDKYCPPFCSDGVTTLSITYQFRKDGGGDSYMADTVRSIGRESLLEPRHFQSMNKIGPDRFYHRVAFDSLMKVLLRTVNTMMEKNIHITTTTLHTFMLGTVFTSKYA